MVIPEEIKRKRKNDIITGIKAYSLSLVNLMICWLNFTITRLASIVVFNYYTASIYKRLEKTNQLSSIGGINRLGDMVTILISLILCMIFIFWVWHRYEVVQKKKGLLGEFSLLTGWQMLEVALAGLVMVFFNYLMVGGKMELMKPFFSGYAQELNISGACLVLGIAGVISGTILKKRMN